MKHGDTRDGRAWCASCNDWIDAGSDAAARLFAVEHAHGQSVAERLAARRALIASLATDERRVADVQASRKAMAQCARAVRRSTEQWRIS